LRAVEDRRGLIEEALDSVVRGKQGWESGGNAAIIRRISYQWKMGMVQLVKERGKGEWKGEREGGRTRRQKKKERRQRLFTYK
jgi:hypothetical protein